MGIVEDAKQLARRAHKDQIRKDGVSYIIHPERVAKTLTDYGFDDVTISAGWLHDTLEDTNVSEDEIEAISPELPAIIKAVTEDSSLPWVERKKKFTDNLKHASNSAKAVACADRIDNLTDFLNLYKTVGSELWKKWPERAPEQKLESDQYFLNMLKQTWDHNLLIRLEALVLEESEIVSSNF